jgi:hypothetical protein
MSNIFDTEPTMPSLTYEERSLYGMLFADLAVYIPYVMQNARTNTLGRIAGTLLLLMVVQIVLQIIIAAATRNRLQDERDTLIRLRGYRAGYLAFVSFIVVGLGILWLHAAAVQSHPEHMAIHFLSVMFGMLVLADVVRIITQLIAYRRAV